MLYIIYKSPIKNFTFILPAYEYYTPYGDSTIASKELKNLALYSAPKALNRDLWIFIVPQLLRLGAFCFIQRIAI